MRKLAITSIVLSLIVGGFCAALQPLPEGGGIDPDTETSLFPADLIPGAHCIATRCAGCHERRTWCEM